MSLLLAASRPGPRLIATGLRCRRIVLYLREVGFFSRGLTVFWSARFRSRRSSDTYVSVCAWDVRGRKTGSKSGIFIGQGEGGSLQSRDKYWVVNEVSTFRRVKLDVWNGALKFSLKRNNLPGTLLNSITEWKYSKQVWNKSENVSKSCRIFNINVQITKTTLRCVNKSWQHSGTVLETNF